MEKIKVGIIGAGRIGKVHMQSICNNVNEAEVKAVSDVNMNDELSLWIKNLGIENTYKEADAIINDPEIKAVLVCSTTETHAQYIIQAARAGKHVFSEKPLDLNPDRILEVLEEVKKAGIKFQIGFQRRFDHNHRKVYEDIQVGKIGTPQILKITSRDPAPPPIGYIEISGGIYIDCMIHDFDMARYLMGDEVDEVCAYGSCLVDPAIGKAGDVDTATVMLKFKNGGLGLIDNSRQAVYGHDQRVEVLGSKGCVMDFNEAPSNSRLFNVDGVIDEKPLNFFLERYMGAYGTEIKEFFSAIVNDTDVPCGGKAGLYSVLIAKAATESFKTGKMVKVDYSKY